MYGYFCIGFINVMFGGKSSVYYSSLSSPYSFEKMLIW